MLTHRPDPASALGPAVAGTWYPAGGQALAREVDSLMVPATGEATGPVLRALIAPHAGFSYSGPVAGRAFARTRGRRPARVLLLGPSHYGGFAGGVLPRASRYRTPLGEVPIDVETITTLRDEAGLRVDDGPFRPEHSLEAEIPFLQRALEPGWRLLPLLTGGGSSSGDIELVARALGAIVDDDTLIVVSSDFTHFGPRFGYTPFSGDLAHEIEELDMGAVRCILDQDLARFDAYLERTRATICGRDAIRVLLRLLPGALEGRLVAYDTSGRMMGDWGHSVSYASLVFAEGAAA